MKTEEQIRAKKMDLLLNSNSPRDLRYVEALEWVLDEGE
jgi:hypothetical protein